MSTLPVKLNELDKTEFRDVCKKLRPDISEEEFERDWAEFCSEKAKRALQ